MESEPCLQGGTKVVVSTYNQKRRIRMDGPDGGWAWCVAFAACLINFIMAGLGRMSGILYVAFIELFEIDRKGASTPFSVRSSTRNLLGPIVGILGQKYGVRAVTITGGILGTLSAASCFFAQDIVWVTIIWGGLNGAGTALTTTLVQVVIGQYFKKHRTTASGMAFSGGCIGSFLFPVLLEKLLQTYGLEGTFLVIAGIIMHTIPAAMILRKPPWMKNGSKLPEEFESGIDAEVVASAKIYPFESDAKVVPMDNASNDVNGINFEFLRQSQDIVLKLLMMATSGENKTCTLEVNQKEITEDNAAIVEELEYVYFCAERCSDKSISTPKLEARKGALPSRMHMNIEIARSICRKSASFHSDKKQSRLNPQTMIKVKSVPDISKFQDNETGHFILERLRELCRCNGSQIVSDFPENIQADASQVLLELQKLYRQCEETCKRGRFHDVSLETVQMSTDEVNTIIPDESQVHTCGQSNTFMDHIKTAVKLYTKPLFLLICLCRAVHFISFIPVVTTIVDFAMDKGLKEEDGKYVIAALSLGDLVGRLCFGWVTDRGYVGLSKYMMVAMVLQAASTASLPLMYAKATLLPNIAIFGMLQGSVFVRHPVLVSKYMESNEQSIAMGCINFFSGFLGFGLPSYIGYFRDTIGSYDNIYYINGSIGATVGLLWIFEPYLMRCSHQRRRPTEEFPESV